MSAKNTKKTRKQRQNKSSATKNETPTSKPQAQETVYSEDPLFTSILFSPLMIGSLTGSKAEPPHMLLFVLILICLMASFYFGRNSRKLDKKTPPIEIASTLGELQKNVKKPAVQEAESFKKYSSQKLFSLFAGIGALAAFFYTSQNVVATEALILCMSLVGVISFHVIKKPKDLIMHVGLIVAFTSLLVILGVFSQTNEIHVSTFILGFVPGTFLAASTVSDYASFLDKLGWRRSISITKVGSVIKRPGSITRLYSALLTIGVFTAAILSILGYIPRGLMVSVLTMVFVPKLATSFLEGSVSDETVSKQTRKLAILSVGLMMLAGLFSRA